MLWSLYGFGFPYLSLVKSVCFYGAVYDTLLVFTVVYIALLLGHVSLLLYISFLFVFISFARWEPELQA